MIEKLNPNNRKTANKIRALFQAAYRVEAELLNVIDFPPLKRKLIDYTFSDTEYFGFLENGEIAGIVEIKSDNNTTDIHSLVVHPKHFRQGIGRHLLLFVVNTFDTERFIVETGLKNEPATNLYKQLGFVEEKQWDTDFGIRKVGFVKSKKSLNAS